MVTVEQLTERTKVLARVLSQVKTCAQALAVIKAAERQCEEALVVFSVTKGEEDALNMLRPALAASRRKFESLPPTAVAPAADWQRARSFIERVNVERAGIEGRLGALEQVSFADCYVEALSKTAGDIAEGAVDLLSNVGEAAGKVGGSIVWGILKGLGLGVLVIVGVVVVYKVAKKRAGA